MTTAQSPILIVGPPRAGNKWLKCLLGRTYGLPPLSRTAPPGPGGRRGVDPVAWARTVAPDPPWIAHHHFDYDPAFVEACEAAGIRLVTILRDPYAMWRSSYALRQQPPRQREGRPLRFQGEAMESRHVLRALRRGAFVPALAKGIGWLESGRSQIIRYEDLRADPQLALARLTERLGAVPPARAAAAVAACEAEQMRARQPRSVSPGRTSAASEPPRESPLPPEVAAIFRAPPYAELITRLGYPLR